MKSILEIDNQTNWKGNKFLLKDLIELEIFEYINSNNYIIFNHPSSFNSKLNDFTKASVKYQKRWEELFIVRLFSSTDLKSI